MTDIIEQMKFCEKLTGKLTEAVVLHENRRNTLNEKSHNQYCWGGWDNYDPNFLRNGAAKTQIQSSIVQLRRELSVLSKMFEV